MTNDEKRILIKWAKEKVDGKLGVKYLEGLKEDIEDIKSSVAKYKNSLRNYPGEDPNKDPNKDPNNDEYKMLIHKISGWRAMPSYVCICNDGPGEPETFFENVEKFNDSCQEIYDSDLWPDSNDIDALSKSMTKALNELSGIIKKVN